MNTMIPRGARGAAAAGLLLLCLNGPVAAAGPGEALWLDVSASGAGGRRLELDLASFRELLAAAPREVLTPQSGDGVLRTRVRSEGGEAVVSLPLPDGRFRSFRVEESPIGAEDAADPCPEVRTYRGVAVDDPAVTTRFALSPSGLRALVLGDGPAAFVEPEGSPVRYASFTPSGADLRCGTSGGDGHAPEPLPSLGTLQAATGEMTVLRLAMATSGELTRAEQGRAGACRLRKELVNQVSAIFESELGLRLELVADGGSLLFEDPATDPYTSQAITSTLLEQNQKALDDALGALHQEYDVGHLLVTSEGPGVLGKGDIGSACSPEEKGKGASNLDSVDLSDPAKAIVVITHEIGHQLGAQHTFNCREIGSPRAGDSAYEPGYGSTLMSYGNQRCDGFSLGWDDYFHVTSLLRIRAHVLTCSPASLREKSGSASLDIRPAFAEVTIPRETPFILAASGNAATYTWEEVDLAPADRREEYPYNRPLFRSFPPSPLSLRSFPRFETLLQGRSSPGEELPRADRTMAFIVTGRDGQGGLGGAATAVTVEDRVGPFRVTAPDAKSVWRPGLAQAEVLWNVAGTDEDPVRCAEVSIHLYAGDGRQLAVLAPRVPNNGAAQVAVPDLPERLVLHAHVLVSCVSSPFFNVSAGFTYEPRDGQQIADVPPVAAFEHQRGLDVQSVVFDSSPSFDLDGTLDKLVWSFGDGKGYSGEKRKFTYKYQAAGSYTVTLTVSSGGASTSVSQVVLVPPKPPSGGGRRELGDPRAIIDTDPWEGRLPVTVRFRARIDPFHPFVRAVWEIQDPVQPETVEAETASHTFTTPGDHRVLLTVWDAEGRIGRAEELIHVDFPPEAAFSIAPSGLHTLAFDASSSRDVEGRIVRFSWDFGDIRGGEGERVVHTFPGPGTYRVRLQVQDELGATGEVEEEVTVLATRPPVASIVLDPPSGPAPLTVFLNYSGTHDPDGRIVKYIFTIDGQESVFLESYGIVTTFYDAGRHTVRLVVEDDQGARSEPAEAIAIATP